MTENWDIAAPTPYEFVRMLAATLHDTPTAPEDDEAAVPEVKNDPVPEDDATTAPVETEKET